MRAINYGEKATPGIKSGDGKKELKRGGIEISTNLDHRMAMSALVMGLISIKEVKIDNAKTIKTSFPNFYNLMIKIGAKLFKK